MNHRPAGINGETPCSDFEKSGFGQGIFSGRACDTATTKSTKHGVVENPCTAPTGTGIDHPDAAVPSRLARSREIRKMT